MPVLFGRCTWWRIFNLRHFLSYLLFFMAFFSIAVRSHCERKIRVTVPSAVRPVTPLLYLLQMILPMTRFFPSAFYAMNAFFEGRLVHFIRRSAPLVRIGIVCSFVLQTGRPGFVSYCANRHLDLTALLPCGQGVLPVFYFCLAAKPVSFDILPFAGL